MKRRRGYCQARKKGILSSEEEGDTVKLSNAEQKEDVTKVLLVVVVPRSGILPAIIVEEQG